MYKFKIDYELGKTAEKEIYDLICNFWDDNIKKSNKKYEQYDYIGDKYYYELKSRRNYYNSYPDTMIAKDKILENADKKQIFLFKFIDGLYYIKYRKKKFDKYKCEIFGRNDRCGLDIKKPYFFIPIEDLKKIEI